MKQYLWILPLFILGLQSGFACRGDGDDADDPGGDGDVDGDADGDSDVDSDADADADAGTLRYGDAHAGQYHLGPVDFAESDWHNACAPLGGYRQPLQDVTGLSGEYIAGVANEYADGGGICDACILIETETGRSIVARLVTYGVENEAGDIDVSSSVYEALNQDEYPRSMSWVFTNCPDTGPLQYEFQTEANAWWTSLWVRNPKVPITTVEVKSANHADYFTLRRETDGTLNDDGGFGEGAFTLRITAMDGQVIEDTFDGFEAGELISSTRQFQ